MTPATASPSLVERSKLAAEIERQLKNYSTVILNPDQAREAIEVLAAAPAPEDAELVKEARRCAVWLREYAFKMAGTGKTFPGDNIWDDSAGVLDRVADRLSRPALDPWCYDMEKAPRGDNGKRIDYILISDGVCVPDIVCWHYRRPARVIAGTQYLEQPEGWFCVNGGRSRLDNSAKMWMPLPAPPTPPGKEGQP